MSSAPAFTLRAHLESSLGERLSSTLLRREPVALVTVSTGIAALDALTGGLPRGALSEITGPASSGRTSVMLAALAGATRRQEVCALVDASDSFDPASAAAAGIDLDRLLWVRCGERTSAPSQKGETPDTRTVRPRHNAGFAFCGVLEQVLKVTDLLLQGGGFGMVALDLGDVPVESARRVPLTSWFRFRRAVEPTTAVLLLIEQEACAKTCASLVVRLEQEAVCACNVAQQTEAGECSDTKQDRLPHVPKNNDVSHASLFRGMRFRAEMLRSAMQRKLPQSAGARFELRTFG